MSKEEILKKIGQIPFWWHYIELGHGIVTPGHQGGENNPGVSKKILAGLHLPDSLKGKTVLDIGAFDGLFSFEAEKRGASRVLAIDNFDHLAKEGKHLERGFEPLMVAREILAADRVECQELDVMDISSEKIGTFDVVLFLGVLYHLKNPFLALEKIASVTKEMMILESLCIDKYNDEALAWFYEKDEWKKDPTNWWGPNQKCAEAMVRAAGFKKVECVDKSNGRITLHAFK
jgi:tRNA (mo5U34)-methyltransferase